MDQLLNKIRETQSASQQAEAARVPAQLAYYRTVETAHERLVAFHDAEHELLVRLIQQRNASAASAVPEPASEPAHPAAPAAPSLAAIPEEPATETAPVETSPQVGEINVAPATETAPVEASPPATETRK